MPLSNPYPLGQWDDEIRSDVSAPVNGVNNALPPSAIDQSLASSAENRLAYLDGLNRPRPGITRLAQTTGGSLDSVHHVGNGVFLCNNGSAWYTWNNRGNVWTSVSGGPAYAAGTQVYSTLANSSLYFSSGSTLDKYTPGSGFGTVTLPTQYPTALYPVWEVYRLVYVYGNTLVVSDALNPEHVDVITGTVTLDPITTDVITGQCLWQDQKIAVFRNGSTWLVETGPGLDVPNWSVNRVSANIGCRCHGTIVQAGNDVFFLSETGRGVYALGQAPTSDQEGIWLPVSKDIQPLIDRINWSACDNARATFWQGAYILAVPLDGAVYNNFMLVYSTVLNVWQGQWCFEIGSEDVAPRDFARDRTDPAGAVLVVATRDGIVSRFSNIPDRQYYDQNMDGSRQYYDSSLVSRSFTFGEDINQFRPHSVRLQFLDSDDPVTVTALGDRAAELIKKDVATTSYLLTLTIPSFPFDLDIAGYKIQPIALLATGICSELQIRLEGTGNWTLYQIKASAFESMPLVVT